MIAKSSYKFIKINFTSVLTHHFFEIDSHTVVKKYIDTDATRIV